MGMVKKSSFFVIVFFISISAFALNQAVNVVEIANFYCPECYKAYQNDKSLIKVIHQTGGHFDFVPIFFGKVSPWPALIYLSVPKQYRHTSKKALFNAAIVSGIAMESAESACTVVNDLSPKYSVETCIKRANSSLPAVHLSRAFKLLEHAYGKKGKLVFPIFIVERGGKIITVLSRSQYPKVSVLVNEVKRYVTSI